MKKTAILFFITAIVLAASAASFGQARKLEGSKWKLIEADGVAVTRSTASLEFSSNAARFTGNTGCNSMFGSVFIRGRRIDFTSVATTKRMCKLMAGNVAENVYTDALKNATAYRRNGDVLRLFDRRGRKILEFTAILGDDRDDTDTDDRTGLGGGKWILEQIRGRQTFVALPNAFLNFNAEKGSAGGNTSCNVFGGSYRASGDTISFTDIIGTMRACVEDDRMSVERDFLDGLRAANRYEIRGGGLHLYKGKQILLTFRGENK